ncbi:LysR substrate-binding domain-containing protein [Ensifer adhaerens]|jgi:DNA-binding transcriptional LysR family regulator|uniref:LysR substrate-binding domain-containing protein n=1 Tax=Ensifer adhaerens TaxID=106592 RepID=UPI0020301522|nr:LysR substrate-binding domain-containing protein [Ensifer adhaerens]
MISDQIGIDLLRSFVAVCRQGSLNRVATQTGRTQSALSMQMRRLEDLLGRQLFTRTGRGVVPTPEGELFLGYATRMLALGDEAAARLRQADLSGGVRVGLAEEVATTALPEALGRLRRGYQEIRLDVVVEQCVALGKTWPEGDLDIMVVPTSVVTADALTTWNVELQWVCATDYAFDETRPIDLVAFAAPCLWRRRMIETLADQGREHRITFTSQSITALQAAIENGLGIGLLPPDAIRAGTMRALPASSAVPKPFAVQYGLFARDRRSAVVDCAISVLLEGLPIASRT